MTDDEITHPINYASRRSGLSQHVIRAWERRYGAVEPLRTTTNRRSYTEQHVERLRLLKALCDGGHSIGSIARLSDDELRGMLAKTRLRVFEPPTNERLLAQPPADPGMHLEQCKETTRNQDEHGLRTALSDAHVSLGLYRFLTDVVGPLMEWVGNAWHDGELRISHEHLTSAVVRGYLSGLRDSSDGMGGEPAIVFSTPTDQHHEIGAQIAALLAGMEGWAGVYLGPNLPAEELVASAGIAGARAVALSVIYVPEAGRLLAFLKRLKSLLPESTELIVGGSGGALLADDLRGLGIRYVVSVEAFRTLLRELRLQTGTGGAS